MRRPVLVFILFSFIGAKEQEIFFVNDAVFIYIKCIKVNFNFVTLSFFWLSRKFDACVSGNIFLYKSLGMFYLVRYIISSRIDFFVDIHCVE